MQKKLSMVDCACHSSHGGKLNRRTVVQASLGKKKDPISKASRDQKRKRAGGMVQAVQHLPCKCEALSSKPKY
jgi:hypothetical protein